MAVLKAETDAWLRRDFDALARHWVHAPTTRRMMVLAKSGAAVLEGWDEISVFMRGLMERYPETFDLASSLRWDRVNIVVGSDIAWVSYDQIGTDPSDGFDVPGLQHELKIFHRMEGTWKIASLVVIQVAVEHATCPLIEVDGDCRVLWMNSAARVQLRDHSALVVAAGRLRARRRDRSAALKEAVGWAYREKNFAFSPRHKWKTIRAVPLGEDDASVPQYCWVTFEDGKALVSFNDDQMLARRIDLAAEVYDLSPAQARLAHLIVDGRDLASAADALGVSINTLRTHLQRIFDKTGVRSQAALVRALLSTESPTGQP